MLYNWIYPSWPCPSNENVTTHYPNTWRRSNNGSLSKTRNDCREIYTFSLICAMCCRMCEQYKCHIGPTTTTSWLRVSPCRRRLRLLIKFNNVLAWVFAYACVQTSIKRIVYDGRNPLLCISAAVLLEPPHTTPLHLVILRVRVCAPFRVECIVAPWERACMMHERVLTLWEKPCLRITLVYIFRTQQWPCSV